MICLIDIFCILYPDTFIRVFSENYILLFNDVLWHFDYSDKYMLSCPVVALKRVFRIIEIIIAYD